MSSLRAPGFYFFSREKRMKKARRGEPLWGRSSGDQAR